MDYDSKTEYIRSHLKAYIDTKQHVHEYQDRKSGLETRKHTAELLENSMSVHEHNVIMKKFEYEEASWSYHIAVAEKELNDFHEYVRNFKQDYEVDSDMEIICWIVNKIYNSNQLYFTDYEIERLRIFIHNLRDDIYME